MSAEKPRLYLSRLLPDSVMTSIRDSCILVNEPSPDPPMRRDLIKGVRECQAILSTLTEQIDEEVIDAAPHVRIIANYAVGYNNIAIHRAQARRIVVSNTPDVLTETTADLTWALILAVARRIPEGHRLVKTGSWQGWAPTQLLGADVHGKRLGIIGLGRIGTAVARRATGFGMRVLYCEHHHTRPADANWESRPFERLLAEVDFLTLHVPLNDNTYHLIGRYALEHMPSSSYLINTSRGPLVDEEALVEALRTGRIAGAALDVYEHEPAVHPDLRNHDSVVTLPHLGSATLSTRVRMGMMCLENIKAIFEGRRAPNEITF